MPVIYKNGIKYGGFQELPIVQTTGNSEVETMSQDAITTALNGKVDKTTTINEYTLDDDITLSKADIGLGNVDNVKQVAYAQGASNKGKIFQVDNSGNVAFVTTSDLAILNNHIWGGIRLNDIMTKEELLSRISSGNYTDFKPGSYWEGPNISTTTFGTTTNPKIYIAENKGYAGIGDTSTVPENHLLCMIDAGASYMNDTNTTAGGYKGCKVAQNMGQIQTYLENLFGAAHIASARVLMTNTVNASTPSMAGLGWTGASTNWGWETAKCWLPNEVNVYGSSIFSSSAMDCGGFPRHLAMFRFGKHWTGMLGRSSWWLSSVASSPNFANADNLGGSASGTGAAAYSLRVRPLFVLI